MSSAANWFQKEIGLAAIDLTVLSLGRLRAVISHLKILDFRLRLPTQREFRKSSLREGFKVREQGEELRNIK